MTKSKLWIAFISLQSQMAFAQIVYSDSSNQNTTGYSSAPRQGTVVTYGHDYSNGNSKSGSNSGSSGKGYYNSGSNSSSNNGVTYSNGTYTNNGSAGSTGNSNNNYSNNSTFKSVNTFKCEDYLVDGYGIKRGEAFSICSNNNKLAEKIDSTKFEKCLVEIPKAFTNRENDILCVQLQSDLSLLTDPTFMNCVNKSIATVSPYYFFYEAVYNLDRQEHRLRRLMDECKAGTAAADPSAKVQVANQFYIHSSMLRGKNNSQKYGGLSGVWFDAKERKFLAISDDQGEPFISRFTWDFETPGTKPDIADIVTIEKRYDMGGKNANNFSFGKQFDYEDIVKLNDGTYLTSNEVDGENAYLQVISNKGKILEKFPHDSALDTVYDSKENTWDCSYRDYSNTPSSNNGGSGSGNSGNKVSGSMTTKVGWFGFGDNEKDKDKKNDGSINGVWVKKTCSSTSNTLVSGVTNNNAVEALTFDPVSENIFYASEGILQQDKPKGQSSGGGASNINNGDYSGIPKNSAAQEPDFVRLFKQHVKNTQDKSYKKYALESGKDYGLVAMAAVDENRVYTMERYYDAASNGTFIRIFLIDMNKVDSKGFLVKEPIADLNKLKSQLSGAFRKLDNFEGMTLVTGRTGQKYLFLVSDNNFSNSQVTAFVVLKIN